MRRFMQFLIVGVLASITLACAAVPSLDARTALVYSMVEPVVAIYVGDDEQPMGSGVALRRDGSTVYVVTSDHVVSDEATLSAVLPLIASDQRLPVTVVRTLPIYDLALISFDLPLRTSNFEPAQLCNYVPRLGEEVWAVGAGAGMLPFPTHGTVSVSNYDYPHAGSIVSSILHSAPIIYGNSGGPLYAVRGGEPCVAGINAAVRAVFSGPVTHIGIAVASSVVREHL